MNKNNNSYKINWGGINDCSPEWHWETNGFFIKIGRRTGREYDIINVVCNICL